MVLRAIPRWIGLCCILVICNGSSNTTSTSNTLSSEPHLSVWSSSVSLSPNSSLIVSHALAGESLANLNQGEPLALTCGMGSESYEINWYLSESLVPRVRSQTKEKSGSEMSIYVEAVRLEDAGVLRCTAKRKELEDDEKENSVEDIVHVVHLKVNSVSPLGPCGPSFFTCKATDDSTHARSHLKRRRDHFCIGNRFVCDGLVDCPGGEDESDEQCGINPCNAKLRCEDHRCMDPSLCCDPELSYNCTVVHSCCLALIESNRLAFQLGIETSRVEQNSKTMYRVTIIIVAACVFGVVLLVCFVTALICRMNGLDVGRGSLVGDGLALHLGQGSRGSEGRPPLTLHDLDIYFGGLHRGRRGDAGGSSETEENFRQPDGSIAVTYNINNGVQFVAPPPPYRLEDHLAREDLPPPYDDVPADGRVRPAAVDTSDDESDSRRGGSRRRSRSSQRRARRRQEEEEERQRRRRRRQVEEQRAREAREQEEEEEMAMLNNNNGDINGNSDLVNQNLEREQEQRRQVQLQVEQLAVVHVEPAPPPPPREEAEDEEGAGA